MNYLIQNRTGINPKIFIHHTTAKTMQIDRIKISQEINFNGMPTWIGMEASLLPGDDEKDGLRIIQKSITDYDNEAKKEYSQNNRQLKEVSKEAITAADKEIEKVFKKVKANLSKYSNREDAEAYLSTTEFKMNLECKEIIQSLPKKA